MTSKLLLIEELQKIKNAQRIYRNKVAKLIIDNPELFPFLVEIVFDVNNKISIKAAWILEVVCEQSINLLVPYINFFTENLKHLKFESAIRPASKICSFLAISYQSNNKNLIQNSITKKNIEQIIETEFDWLIGKFKVATKAYAMNTLFLFGKEYTWVHKELKLIIEQNISYESPAYKARGKMILNLLNRK